MRILAMAAIAAPALGFLAEPDPVPTASAPPQEPSQEPSQESSQRASIDAEALFIEHCASCHGETGDGEGTADLDRPARSFLDGGYSYGNTQTAVERSIRHGIPGTPMPAFAETLTAEQITAVADHVIALGPEGTVVEPGASVMTVGERPAIVHGMLPSLERGGRREPRSLVVGFPNGTTFAYAKNTCELRAVFVGDFLDRRDWRDRGGSPLKPLGTKVWGGDETTTAAASFADAEGAPLTRKVNAATVTADDSVRLDFDLLDANGEDVGGGEEYIGFIDVEGVPTAMRAVIANGATLPQLDGESVGEVRLGEAAIAVHPAGEGVFALDLPVGEAVRVFVHAPAWSEALESAMSAGNEPEEPVVIDAEDAPAEGDGAASNDTDGDDQ